jgi:hypothetical protein
MATSPFARATKRPLGRIKEWYIDRQGVEICSENKNLAAEVYAAVCVVKRRGDQETLERFFSIDDQQAAGLNSPTWRQYRKLMLKYRARSQALKDKFADCLNGAPIAEYDFHVIPDDDGAAVGASVADDLNNIFGAKVEILRKPCPSRNLPEAPAYEGRPYSVERRARSRLFDGSVHLELGARRVLPA